MGSLPLLLHSVVTGSPRQRHCRNRAAKKGRRPPGLTADCLPRLRLASAKPEAQRGDGEAEESPPSRITTTAPGGGGRACTISSEEPAASRPRQIETPRATPPLRPPQYKQKLPDRVPPNQAPSRHLLNRVILKKRSKSTTPTTIITGIHCRMSACSAYPHSDLKSGMCQDTRTGGGRSV